MSDETGKTHTTNEEGKFLIKAGQIATFAGIKAGTEIQVVEPDTGRIYDVTYTSTDSSGNLIDSGNSGSATVPAAGYVAVRVKNDANAHSKDLTIVKKFMVNGKESLQAPSPEKYNNATYTLKERNDNDTWKELYTVRYSSFTNGTYTFRDLDPRKVYQVVENITDETNGSGNDFYYEKTDYKLDYGNNGTGTTASGIALESPSENSDTKTEFINNKVTFTNYYDYLKAKVSFIKHNEGSTPLPGAVFTLYKEDGTTVIAANLTSDKNGDFTPTDKGLIMGTYYLVETSAPAGYNKLEKRIKIEVSGNGVVNAKLDGSNVSKELAVFDDTTNTYVITVNNSPGVELPNTGGSGTLPYTLGGLMLMSAAALMYGFIMRRRGRRLN